jgi:hypothetical protein
MLDGPVQEVDGGVQICVRKYVEMEKILDIMAVMMEII